MVLEDHDDDVVRGRDRGRGRGLRGDEPPNPVQSPTAAAAKAAADATRARLRRYTFLPDTSDLRVGGRGRERCRQSMHTPRCPHPALPNPMDEDLVN
ncbi:hypothetical protein SAV14893_055800 [Streptomyces avermitilis]|uniref:Uncharacterized protein n=1 Tax=Streptomyces avermitilis TaxID=33903 RepID=A0A4D4M372_STRAX|nr:hypothetical protein SAV14893_055800 [Streptomyces avermitilis]